MSKKRVTINLQPDIDKALEEDALKNGRSKAQQGGIILAEYYYGLTVEREEDVKKGGEATGREQ